MSAPTLIAVMGPTGSGKSDLAERIASLLDAQLINADAFQVYRGFDIGTNKPGHRDRYRLLDIKDPDEDFGVGEWVARALDVLAELWEAGRSAVVVGGTGLYVRALFEEWKGLAPPPDPALRAEVRSWAREGIGALAARLIAIDPIRAQAIDLSNPARVIRALERALQPQPPAAFSLPPFRRVKWGLQPDVDALNARIDARTTDLLERGWLEEVERLSCQGVDEKCPAMRAIGYRTLLRVSMGAMRLEEALDMIRRETRQYAKRQRTWLRSEPHLQWFTVIDEEGLESRITQALEKPE